MYWGAIAHLCWKGSKETGNAYPSAKGTCHTHRETESKSTNGKGHEKAIICSSTAWLSYSTSAVVEKQACCRHCKFECELGLVIDRHTLRIETSVSQYQTPRLQCPVAARLDAAAVGAVLRFPGRLPSRFADGRCLGQNTVDLDSEGLRTSPCLLYTSDAADE